MLVKYRGMGAFYLGDQANVHCGSWRMQCSPCETTKSVIKAIGCAVGRQPALQLVGIVVLKFTLGIASFVRQWRYANACLL